LQGQSLVKLKYVTAWGKHHSSQIEPQYLAHPP